MYHYAANNPVKYTDPDGREDRKGPDLNFLPKCEETYKYALLQKIYKNHFVVAGHGNAVDGIFEYSYQDKNTKEAIKPSELATRIKKHPNYKEGMAIILWACDTGRDTNYEGKPITPYAQKLADELGEGVVVLAPNKKYWITKTSDSENVIADGKPSLDDERKEVPDFNKRGKLIKYVGRKKNEE